MKNIRSFVLYCIILLFPINVLAWDGQVTGKISAIDVAQNGNFDFRVSFIGSKEICGKNTWGYINQSDSNYQSYVSVLLSAKMSNSIVTLYTNYEHNSGHNYCHIGYISIL